ncbi:MAG: excalibur calcium-binding domain-containing protein [Pasteurellaceae bacterium]|nr:excalibur calcium-binding domain-containing protein [Pasteurellaceae bacterium]
MIKVALFIITALFSLNSIATEYDCDRKYCKAMGSCDEAYYQLQICGFTGLDRDGDGVPCENICGKGGKKQSKKSKQKIKALLAEQERENNSENETEQNQ